MKSFYILILTTVTLINATCFAQKKSAKPNVIIIITDDQASTAVHALGNQEIHTPNMDKLVRMGTSFSNAHNMGAWNGAVCVASRAMLISGRSVWQAKEISQHWQKGEEIDKSFGQLMESAGYDTYMTGKWHVSADAKKVFKTTKDVKPGFAGDAWGASEVVKIPNTADEGKYDLDAIMPLGYNRPKNPADTAWKSYDDSDTTKGFWTGGKHWNEVLKDDAVSFIQEASKKDNPFFMYVASNSPHDPRQAPKKYWDMYPLDKISLPKSFLPVYPYKNAIGNSFSLRDEGLAPYPRTPYAIKNHIREYYASITYLDEKVGQIIDALEKSGKMDNTYIFFTSDHGLAVGKHGLLGKQSLFEHSVKPPLIVVGPGIQKNKINETNVYMQDIMASSLQLASVSKPDYVFFNSLIPLAKGEQKTGFYPAIYGSYLNLERSIHEGDYKLILYPRIKKVLLFNLKTDPEEMNNLADQKEFSAEVKHLFKNLLTLQKDLNDTLDLSDWYNEIKS